MKRRIAVPLLVGLTLGACNLSSSEPDSTIPSGESSELLFLEAPSGPAAVDAATGTVVWSGFPAVVAPDYSHIFVGRGDRLVTIDPATGSELSSMTVPVGFTPRVVSPNGHSVALVDEATPDSPYARTGRGETPLVVARPDTAELRTYRLPGDFAPEAFSTNDDSLFLIEYFDDERYRVRMMSLDSGRLFSVGRLTKSAPDSMRGTGRVQVYSPDHSVLYTLYTRQPPNYTHIHPSEIDNKDRVHAFIHVLDLREGWAHCIDLPMPFGMGPTPADVLAVSPDGNLVYAGDGESLALVDTRGLRVRTVTEADIFEAGTAEAAVGLDGRAYFGAGSQVTVLDSLSLQVIDRFPVPGEVGSLTISPDGTELFTALGEEISVLDAFTGSPLRALPWAGANNLFVTETPD